VKLMSLDSIEALPAEVWEPQAHASDALWFAIQTRSRFEKKVASQLQAKGVETFLPLLSEWHAWSDRRKLVHQPLFASYVFVKVHPSPELRPPILTTVGVCGFVGARGAGQPIPEKQILDIRTVVTNSVPFAPYPFVQVGQRVRVRGGCLDGIEGTLLSKNPDSTLVVSVELLMRAVAVQISGYDFESV
jgi:transcription antitermination factor NusG